jgi:HSP20 family protein
MLVIFNSLVYAKEYINIYDEINKFFNSSFINDISYNNYPKMNTFENEEEFIFEFALVNVDKKDIKVSITDKNILKISGKHKELTKKQKDNIIIQERFNGVFNRSISLPQTIDNNSIKVKYENGILKITIKKDQEKIKNKERFIKIN